MLSRADALFFALLRQGLWGKSENWLEAEITPEEWKDLLTLASEQTVLGIVADALDVTGSAIKAPAEVAMRLATSKMTIERRNFIINNKIDQLHRQFADACIPVVVVKGQSIAQCYHNPLSRMPGDIDLVVQPQNYEAAKAVLKKVCGQEGEEIRNRLHFSALVGNVDVEIHGTVHTCLDRKINALLDTAQAELFNAGTDVLHSTPDFDALFIFIHLLQHFYCGGIGLRQLCDMAMTLHAYNGRYDKELLQRRLQSAGLLYEWKAFVSFLVARLGLPEEDAFLYDQKSDSKIDKLWRCIKKSGNFGKNKRARKFARNSNFLLRKIESFFRGTFDFFQHVFLFPVNSLKFFSYFTFTGICATVRGK